MPQTDEEIARVAHAIWEAEGEPEGCDHEHWMRAKQIVQEAREKAGSSPPEAAGAGEPEHVGDATPPFASQPVRELGGRVQTAPVDRPSPSEDGAARAVETPGPRNPEPLPPTNVEGYVAVPSAEDDAPAATKGDRPAPARAPAASR